MKFEKMNAKRNGNGINLQVLINIGDNCIEKTIRYGNDITPCAITQNIEVLKKKGSDQSAKSIEF